MGLQDFFIQRSLPQRFFHTISQQLDFFESSSSEAKSIYQLFFPCLWQVLNMYVFLQQRDNVEGSGPVSWAWFLLTSLRLDYLSLSLSAGHIWFLFTTLYTALSWCLLFPISLSAYLNYSLCSRRLKLCYKLNKWLSDQLLIPLSAAIIEVWASGTSQYPVAIQSLCQWISVPLYFALLCHHGLTICSGFEFDMRAVHKPAKSDFWLDFIWLAYMQVLAWSHAVMTDRSYYLHLLVAFSASIALLWRIALTVPYYDSTRNELLLWAPASIALGSVSQFISCLIGSELCGLLLSAVFSLAAYVQIRLWFPGYYKSLVASTCRELEQHTGNYQWEIGVRKLMQRVYCSHTDEATKRTDIDSVLAVINTALSSHRWRKSSLRVLILKSFILKHALLDYRGAGFCLSLAAGQCRSWSDYYLRAKYALPTDSDSRLEETRYFQYLSDLQSLQHKDLLACKAMETIWKELASAHVNKSLLINNCQHLRSDIRQVYYRFHEAVKSHLGSYELYELYSSFLAEVCCDFDHSKYWKDKATAYIKDGKMSKEEKIGLFDAGTGVILVDLREKTMGYMLYMNDTAAEALSYDAKSVSSSKITGIILPPYGLFHGKCLQKFVDLETKTELEHPGFLPFQTSSGFLLFCNVKVLLTSLNSLPLLTVSFKPLPNLQEGAILSSNYIIEAHTQRFPSLLEADANVKGKSLLDVVPSIAGRRSPNGDSQPFPLFTNRPCIGKFTCSMFAGRKVYGILVFESGEIQVGRNCAKWSGLFSYSELRVSLLRFNEGKSEQNSGLIETSPSLIDPGKGEKVGFELTAEAKRTHIKPTIPSVKSATIAHEKQLQSFAAQVVRSKKQFISIVLITVQLI